jgi:hypothetical protein
MENEMEKSFKSLTPFSFYDYMIILVSLSLISKNANGNGTMLIVSLFVTSFVRFIFLKWLASYNLIMSYTFAMLWTLFL